MQCERCKRRIGDAEPIYRVIIYGEVEHICSECATKAPFFYHRDCRSEPRPCGKCGRPVFHTLWRKEPKIIACSPVCRKTQQNAQYRSRRRVRPTVRQCVCGRSFSPARVDARFGSNACRQKAYRNRLIGFLETSTSLRP
jgi:hypothetical protein